MVHGFRTRISLPYPSKQLGEKMTTSDHPREGENQCLQKQAKDLADYPPVPTVQITSESHAQLAADDRAYQFAGAAARLSAGNESLQWSRENAQQDAGRQTIQIAGDSSRQRCRSGIQLAGTSSAQYSEGGVQWARFNARQASGTYSFQIAEVGATQRALDSSTQVAGDHSAQEGLGRVLQIAGNWCWQKAGMDSVQVTRFHTGSSWRTVQRRIGPEEADRWYFVENGTWRRCTDEEEKHLRHRFSWSDGWQWPLSGQPEQPLNDAQRKQEG